MFKQASFQQCKSTGSLASGQIETSVFWVMDLKILARVGTHIFFSENPKQILGFKVRLP